MPTHVLALIAGEALALEFRRLQAASLYRRPGPLLKEDAMRRANKPAALAAALFASFAARSRGLHRYLQRNRAQREVASGGGSINLTGLTGLVQHW